MPFTNEQRRRGGETTRRKTAGVARWTPRPGISPVVRFLIDAARLQSVTVAALAQRTGISEVTLRNWNRGRYKAGARLADVEACFEALGFSILVVPKGLADRDQDAEGPPRGVSRRPFQEGSAGVTPCRNSASSRRPSAGSA